MEKRTRVGVEVSLPPCLHQPGFFTAVLSSFTAWVVPTFAMESPSRWPATPRWTDKRERAHAALRRAKRQAANQLFRVRVSCTAVGGLFLLVSLPLMFLNGSLLGFRDYGLLGVVAIMGPLVAAIALRPVDVRFVRGVCAILVPVYLAAVVYQAISAKRRGGARESAAKRLDAAQPRETAATSACNAPRGPATFHASAALIAW